MDIKNETDKEFILTVKDEPVIQSKQESVPFIPHPPCSDDYIFIKVWFLEDSEILQEM